MVVEKLTDKKKILIVEDDLDIINLMTELVSDQFSVVVKSLGEDALKFVSKSVEHVEHDVNMVIIDYKLPDISGLEVLKKIKELRPALPVIIITGYSDVDIAVRAFKYGARDYIIKPFKSIHLLEAIHFCLSLKSLDNDLPRKVLASTTANAPIDIFCSISNSAGDVYQRIASSGQHSRQIQKALKYIDDNYMTKLRLKRVARIACMSEYYFSRIFKRVVGITYQDYLNKCRIEQAKNHLKNRTLSITEVAFAVGYDDLSNFIYIFKKVTGSTPSQFARETRNSV